MSYKAGYVALVGWPNAGKSTLLNALVGEKLSIVTQKPQTTRKRITGIYTSDELQAIVLDTPGIVTDEKGLNHYLYKELDSVLKDTDGMVLLLNVDHKNPKKLIELIERYESFNKPKAALITKEDISGRRAFILKEELEKRGWRYEIVSAEEDPLGAKEKLKGIMREMLPESPAPLYDPALFTTERIRDMVGERIREKCFECLHQEIPYGLGVKIRKFEENPKITRIFADIVLDRPSHKNMVIGSKGRMIREIGTQARKDIEKLVDQKVYLELHVAVREKWMQNQGHLEEFGYVVS